MSTQTPPQAAGHDAIQHHEVNRDWAKVSVRLAPREAPSGGLSADAVNRQCWQCRVCAVVLVGVRGDVPPEFCPVCVSEDPNVSTTRSQTDDPRPAEFVRHFHELVRAYSAAKDAALRHQSKLADVSRRGHYDVDGCATLTATAVDPHRGAEQRSGLALADAFLARVDEGRRLAEAAMPPAGD